MTSAIISATGAVVAIVAMMILAYHYYTRHKKSSELNSLRKMAVSTVPTNVFAKSLNTAAPMVSYYSKL